MKTIAQLSALAAVFSGSLVAGDYDGKNIIDPKQPVSQSGNVVGEIGVSGGWNGARMTTDDGNDFDRDSTYFTTIQGSIAFRALDVYTFAFDAYTRHDGFGSSNEFDSNNAPEDEHGFGSHILFDFGTDTRIGGFVGYGDTDAFNLTRNESYDVLMYGFEANTFIREDLMFFAQLGYGDKERPGTSANEGFRQGLVTRAGLTYFANENTALTLDLEYANSEPYIDGNDNGRFFGVTFGGETRISDRAPLFVTYFTRYDIIDATTEGEKVDEMQVGFGIKYLFGADSPLEAARKGRSIGTPRLPTRASAWTEAID